jgi:hypothetical protein
MHHFILWVGFLGGWLLVAGPLYQASVELGEEEFEGERYHRAAREVGPPPETSPWWWLFPPARLFVGRRRRDEWNEQVLRQLPDEDYEAFGSFMRKARGWLFVALGGTAIAAKETYELVEGSHWPVAVFWVLVPAMALLCVLNVAVQARREHTARAERLSTASRTASSPPASEPA